MDDKIVFKTAAVGGFEKKAVTDYIYQMNEDNEYAQQQLKHKISQLEAIVGTLQQEKEEAETAARTLKEELNTTSQRVSSKTQQQAKLSSLSDELSREINGLSKSLNQKEEENTALRQRNTDLEKRYLALEKQQDEIDRTTAQLGRVMLEARTDADHALAEAQKKAEVLVNNAEKEAQELKNSLAAQADTVVVEAQKEAEEILSDARDFAEATRFSATEETETLLKETRTRVASMLSLGESTSQATREHLTSLRQQSAGIQEIITDAFRKILEQSNVLEETIQTAEGSLQETADLAKAADLLQVPELSHEDILAIQKAMESKAQTSLKGESPMKEIKDLTQDETEDTPKIVNLADGMACGPDGCAVPDIPAPAAVCGADGCAVPESAPAETAAPILDLALGDDFLEDIAENESSFELQDDSFALHSDDDTKE